MLKLIVVGKKSPAWLSQPILDYSKRLQSAFQVKWVFIPHSSQTSVLAAQNTESKQILEQLKPSDFVILLDETGRNLSSPELASTLEQQLHRSIVFVVGGAYGVNNQLKQRADLIWSLSRLVFPHQIVRLIVIEQLYRAQCILAHHPYHHQ